MIYHFILNPNSGKRKEQKAMEDTIKSACRKRRLDYHIYYTTCPGDATEYVRSMVNSFKDRQRFICVGGDGTINEIVNSAPCNPRVEFGVIPRGSGNDFVKNFGDIDKFYDINAQLDGTPVSLDLIKCNEHYCANMINIGFDCAVAKEAQKLKFISPRFSYILGVVKVFFRRIGTQMKLTFDDGTVIANNLTLTAIGNGKFCGGGFMAAPQADLEDGLFDVCVIKKVSRSRLLSLIGIYKKGQHVGNPKAEKYITYRRCSHLKMEFNAPVPICIDGEIKGAKTVDLTVIRNAFNFVIPKEKDLIQ
ncbi:MAG: diacylglycerol kinase family lipid kinase [Clostridia bacterium]|nr:diacylglycerol kinase family lipid kinase [Clostridia bacterium]